MIPSTERRPPVHPGEQEVRRLAGQPVRSFSPGVVGIPPGVGDFLARQRLVVAGGADASGAVWASALTGPEGFAGVAGEPPYVHVDADFAPGDPLAEVYGAAAGEEEREIGMLALEPASALRIRINGRARRRGARLAVRTSQVMGNCPKYIQQRVVIPDHLVPARPTAAPRARRGAQLTSSQVRWIESADTFFVASRAEGHGADASHRGGSPGFVRVLDGRRLVWPDYPGNKMYMTLGNLHLDPACGLLFLDWEHGHTLQLTGRARIDWSPEGRAAFPAAERVLGYELDAVVQIDHASPLVWAFGAASPYNPPPPSAPGQDAAARAGARP